MKQHNHWTKKKTKATHNCLIKTFRRIFLKPETECHRADKKIMSVKRLKLLLKDKFEGNIDIELLSCQNLAKTARISGYKMKRRNAFSELNRQHTSLKPFCLRLDT